jgi:hypothetical protein
MGDIQLVFDGSRVMNRPVRVNRPIGPPLQEILEKRRGFRRKLGITLPNPDEPLIFKNRRCVNL